MRTIHEKETIITIMVGCILLYWVFPFKGLWLAAVVTGIAGMTSDKLTHWIHRAWFLLANILGYVMSRLILGAIFCVILIPVALTAKLFRKDMMLLKKGYSSYFVERQIVYQPKDLENPW